MSDLEYIKETININKDILESSEEDVNSLIINDLLIYLGMDRRRSKGVERIRDSRAFDWKITKNNEVIYIKTKVLGAELTIIDSDEYKLDSTVAIIVTDGERLAIFNTTESAQNPIITINLYDNSEDTNQIIGLLNNVDDFSELKNYIKNSSKNNALSIISEAISNKDIGIFSSEFLSKINDKIDVDTLFEAITGNKPDNTCSNSNNTELNELRSKLGSLRAEINNYSDLCEEKDKIIADLNTELTSRVEKFNAIIHDKDTEIEKLKNNNSSINTTETYKDLDTNEYISQIETLNIKISELNKTIAEKDKNIKDLEEQLSCREDPLVKDSRELLDSIEDNKEAERTYVGVVNGNLYQAKTIEKFVGLSIQELYSQVTFDLMQYLFDGEIFRITDKTTRNDMIIANKAYDIDIEKIGGENEALLRLNTLFKKFPSIVFYYKKIGKDNIENIEHNDTNYDSNLTDSDEYENLEFNDDNFNTELGETYNNILNDSPDVFDEQSNLVIDTDNNTEYKDEKEADNENGLYAFAISDISPVLWNDKFEYIKTRYIGFNNTILRINADKLNKEAELILAAIVGMSPELDTSINNISNFNFYEINSFVKTNELDETCVSLPFSKQSLQCNQLGQASGIIEKYCELCNLDPSSIFIYIEAKVYDNSYEDYLINYDIDSSLIYSEDIETSSDDDINNEIHCIISGSILNNTYISDKSFDIYRRIIKKSIAIKTNYLTHGIKNNDDIAFIITEILASAELPVEEIVVAMGTLYNSDKLYISNNEEDVSDNHYTIEINGNNYYVSEVEPWELVWSLIKLHKISIGDYAISIRVILYRDVLEYYKNDYVNSDADGLCATESFINYLASRLRNT